MQQLVFSLILCMSPWTVWGYNFDTLVPTIAEIEIGASGAKEGFGFAITQHEFPDGRKVALVSSPREQGFTLQGETLESEGGVYSCPFDNSQICKLEPAFQSKDNNNPEATLPFLTADNRSYEGQLLGYSLSSFDNHVVACAPLYVSQIQNLEIEGMFYDHGTPNGRCIVLNKNLSGSAQDVLQITNDDLGASALIVGGVDTDIIATDVGGSVREQIAIGSVFSGAMAQGGNPPGQVVVTDIDPDTLGDATTDTGRSSPSVTGLLGYKIEVGRFTEAVLQVASSAPRANVHHGQIKIFNVPSGGDLSVQITINGPESDGYFGYDFVAHSFSEDGMYDSLIVGCPLCSRDKGAVFVYLHSGDRAAPFPADPVRIVSPDSSAPGRFGTAVSVIGDIDGDGISDVAISAPYLNGGVVYICRGFRGGIMMPEQAIRAVPMATTFGYTLSGGLDVDDNGYPDLTIGDLSGTVTTVRTSPLVSVTMAFDNLQGVVDLVEDRKCQVDSDITLLCFDVSPCFYYEPLHSEDVPQFAFKYTLTVDGDQASPRVVLLSEGAGGKFVVLTENEVTDNVTMSGAGVGNRLCTGTYTFAIRADFVETTPIPVHLAVSESDSVPPLPADSAPPTFGGPLTPVLRRYTKGDQLASMEITHEVFFGLNCNGGSSPDCEPDYTIEVSPSFDGSLVLAPGNSFGYDILIHNMAEDDGLSPILVVDLPHGILFNETVSNSRDAVTNCSGTSQLRCLLRNPMPAQSSLNLTVSFRFNATAIPLTTPSLAIQFSVVDGLSGNAHASANSLQTINLSAEASFGIGVIVTEEQYQARRHALTQDTQTIPLNETGPTLRFSVLVSNSRGISKGTTIPTSTVIIHIPVAIQPDRNAELKPLLIPYELVSASGNINCSRFNVVPRGLSTIQQPSNFVPPGAGPLPESAGLQECAAQKGELEVQCGTIVCSVRELEAGAPPSQVTVFAYLFSPSIIVKESFVIFADVNTTVEGLEIVGAPEDSFTSVSFDVLPAVREVSLECFQYWIIVVSVVAGLLALLILIGALACCGVFGRWYKRKGETPPNTSAEATDGSRPGSTYGPRTIPPLPGSAGGGRVRSDCAGDEDEEVKVDLGAEEEEERRKHEEAELERQLEAETNASTEPEGSSGQAGTGGAMNISLDQFNFDPHLGVSDSGEETEI